MRVSGPVGARRPSRGSLSGGSQGPERVPFAASEVTLLWVPVGVRGHELGLCGQSVPYLRHWISEAEKQCRVTQYTSTLPLWQFKIQKPRENWRFLVTQRVGELHPKWRIVFIPLSVRVFRFHGGRYECVWWWGAALDRAGMLLDIQYLCSVSFLRSKNSDSKTRVAPGVSDHGIVNL